MSLRLLCPRQCGDRLFAQSWTSISRHSACQRCFKQTSTRPAPVKKKRTSKSPSTGPSANLPKTDVESPALKATASVMQPQPPPISTPKASSRTGLEPHAPKTTARVMQPQPQPIGVPKASHQTFDILGMPEQASEAPATPTTSAPKNTTETMRPAPRPTAPALPTYQRSPDGTSSSERRQMDDARRLLGDKNELLLYTAPPHGSLVLTSAIGGTLFLTVCSTVAQTMIMVPNFPLLLKIPAFIGAGLGIGISSTLFWAPIRQINSLRLIKDPERGILAQVESKSRLLTSRPRRFSVALKDIRADRNIKASAVEYFSVERSEGPKWTEFVQRRDEERANLQSRLKLAWQEFDFRQSLSEFWPSFKRDTGRMFARSGMTYIRIENQNWKMDLTKAYLLDRGFPLTELIKEDPVVRDNFLGVVRRQFSST